MKTTLTMSVKTRVRKNGGFCGFFTGKPPVKNPLAGQTSDFHASCGKISMVNFQKECNCSHSRDTTTMRRCDVGKLQAGLVVPPKPGIRKDGGFFCGFFTGKPPVKNPLAGQTSDFHASCGKISMVNYQVSPPVR